MNQAPGPESMGKGTWLAPLAGAVALVAAALALGALLVALLLRSGAGQAGPTARPGQTHVAQAPTRDDASHTSAPVPSHTPSVEISPTSRPPATPTEPPEPTPAEALDPSPTHTSGATDRPPGTPTPMPSHTPVPTPTATATAPQTPVPTAPPAVGALPVWPYLGETTPDSVVISWATENPGNSEVRYGLDPSLGEVVPASSSIYDGKHWHSAIVSGLEAGTTYHYRVYTAGQDRTPWPEVTFTTAPDPSSTAFFFAALGDSRPGKESDPPKQGALDVAARLAQEDVDLALHTGDLVHSGGVCSGEDSGPNQYLRAYFDLYRDSAGRFPFYPAVGNHEMNGGDCGYQAYTELFHLPGNAPEGDRETYYSFDWASAHFVALDTRQSYSPGSAQHDWLLNDLQSTAQPWVFVFTHYPAYSSAHHGSSEKVQARLVPVFEEYGVDLVFAGHDHAYERTCPIRQGACTTPEAGGVVYIVTGGGGASLYQVTGDWFTEVGESINHFLRVEVDGCRLVMEAVDTQGNIFDSYHLDRCVEGGEAPRQ